MRAARTLEGMSTVEGLTSLAKAGGCAAKYSAARLEELLAGIVPAIDARFTTYPRASRSAGSASRVTRNAPRRLTACWRSNGFVSMSPIRPNVCGSSTTGGKKSTVKTSAVWSSSR